MNIQPIQTAYKGRLFRSRTEARYAVFFDALKLSWGYEIEGFDLPEVGRYLPDFYLYDLDLWVEIKGGKVDFRECKKAQALSTYNNCAALVLFGRPRFDWPSEYGRVFGWNEYGNPTAGDCAGFVRADLGVSLDINITESGSQLFADQARTKRVKYIGQHNRIGSDFSLASAYTEATSARFEFGHSGATL